MDYKRIYDDLMQSRLLIKEDRIKLRKDGEYFESHHILPKSLGGKGDAKTFKHPNIVILTPREHYIAHALLFLIYRNREMAYAFKSMCNMKKGGKRSYIVSAKLYAFLKEEKIRLGISEETRIKLKNRKRSPEAIEKTRLATLGRKHTPEAREKIRQASSSRKHTPEAIEKIRQSKLGKKCSPETKLKMRQSQLGIRLSPETIEKAIATKKRNRELGITKPQVFSKETREKLSKSHLGRKHTPEAKEKMRQSSLGRKHTPEAIEKMRQRKPSPETREKMRQANLGKKMSPETREKIRQSSLGRKHTPEARERMRQAYARRKLEKLNGNVSQGE